MMARSAMVLLLALAVGTTHRPCSPPLLEVDISSKYHIGEFVEAKRPALWNSQHGMAFSSANTLVIYHVDKDQASPHLERRTTSGGGGMFTLRALFLDARNGGEVHELGWTTSASDYSQVFATHDGRFIVRTGSTLRVYSPGFQEIASKTLPTDPKNIRDYWFTVLVSPGKFLFAEHHWSNGPHGPWGNESSLIDCDALTIIPNPSPNDVALWPDASHFWPNLATR